MNTRLQKIILLLSVVIFALTFSAEVFPGQNLKEILRLVQEGKISAAKAAFAQLEKQKAFGEHDVLALCDSLEAQGQVSLAVECLSGWRSDHSFSKPVEERLAADAVQLEKFDLAINVYKELAGKYPENRRYWLQLGKLYTWTEKQKQAIHAYERAVQLNPRDIKTLKKLAQLYSWTNQDEKAFVLQREILKLNPQDVALWKKHGIQARWLGKNEEAIESFKNALLRNPRDAEAFFLLGETYLWTNQSEKAKLCFRESLKLNPNNVKAHFYWAQLRQWEPFGWFDARENYRWVLRHDPADTASRKGLAQIRKIYGPFSQAAAGYIHDSNNLKRIDGAFHSAVYFSARGQLRAEVIFNQLEENKPTGHFLFAGEGSRIGGLWHASLRTRFLGFAGGIHYNKAGWFPIAELQWQETLFDRSGWPGGLYSSLSFVHDQVLDGVLAIKNHYTANRTKWSLYWQADSALHVGSDFQSSWYSDQNHKTQLYVLGEYRFFSGTPHLFFTALFAYENMKHIYANAVPYWTPYNFWTRSGGLAVQINPLYRLTLRGDLALTQQTDSELAFNWKAKVEWNPNDFGHAFLLFQNYGSKYYSFRAVQSGFSYRW